MVEESKGFPEDMKRDVFDLFEKAIQKYDSETKIAKYIKKGFDKKHISKWHCVVGKSFSSCLSAVPNSFYALKVGPFYIEIWKIPNLSASFKDQGTL